MSHAARFAAAFTVLLIVSAILAAPPVRLQHVTWLMPSEPPVQWTLTRCGAHQESGTRFTLFADPGCQRPAAGSSFPVRTQWSHLRVTVNLAVDGARAGTNSWDRPLLSLSWTGADDQLTDYGAWVFENALGTRDLGPQSEIFPVPAGASRLYLRFVMGATAGAMTAHGIRIEALDRRPGMGWAHGLVLMLWILLLYRVGRRELPRFGSLRARVLVALITAGLVVGALSPRGGLRWLMQYVDREAAVASGAEHASEGAPQPPSSTPANGLERALRLDVNQGRIANLGHLMGFLSLALVMGLNRPRNEWTACALVVLGLAVATEILQGFTPARHPTVADFFLDLGGAALGFAFAALWHRRPRFIRPQKV